MDVIINGSKFGWKGPFFVASDFEGKTFSPFICDMRTLNSIENAIGKSTYALSMTDVGCAYGKYVVVYDQLRDGTGFVSFWIHLPAKKKISGKNALELLDTLCGKYCASYITQDYSLEGTIKEDWTFVNDITAAYESKISTFSEYVEFKRGTESPAFLYYKDEAELEKYFDDPYNEAYSKYSQVLFIDASYKDRTDSPLMALKHQDKNLTGQIEIGNPQFLLSYSETTKDGVKIDVLVNGGRPHNKSMRKRDNLTITYSKIHHETKRESGKLSEMRAYVDINEGAGIVAIKEISLTKKESNVKIKVTDKKGKLIIGADIKVKCGNNEKAVNDNNEVMFAGDEIGLKWTATVTKADMKTDKDFSPAQTDFVEVKLMRKKKIAVTFQDAADNSPIKNFSLNKGGYKVDIDELEFIDDEIDSLQTFSVSHPNYQAEIFKFRPSEVTDSVYVKTLEKVVKLKDGPYRLKIDPRKGQKLRSGDTLPHQVFVDPRGNRNFDCKARFGYVFDGWDGPVKLAAGMSFEARFKERWWHRRSSVIALFSVCILTVGLLFIFTDKGEQIKQPVKPSGTSSKSQKKTDSNIDSHAAAPKTDSLPPNDTGSKSVPAGRQPQPAVTNKIATTETQNVPAAKKQLSSSNNLDDKFFDLAKNPDAKYGNFKDLLKEYEKSNPEEPSGRIMQVLKEITENKSVFKSKWESKPAERKRSINSINDVLVLLNSE
jgi:hypothetical protein